MVENKMAVAKIFDFAEAKAIARKHATLHPEPEKIICILDKFDDNYDYIFEILHQEMLEGDMPPLEIKCDSADSIIQDGDYRVIEYDKFSGSPMLYVLKILTIDNQDF